MSRYIMVLFFVLAGISASAQHYKYIDSTKISGRARYKKQVKANPDKQLVEIKRYIPQIALDILVWIYYTSAILYIGAEFTQVYAEASGSHIEPAEYAVHVQQTEVERHVKKLPAQNPELVKKGKEMESKEQG